MPKRISLFETRGWLARNSSSSALIIVLFFVSLLTILLVGFLASMRIENISSKSHLDGVSAEVSADNAVATAVSQIYSATSSPYGFYTSHPGNIAAFSSTGTLLGLTNLSSGIETNVLANISTDEAVDLNPPVVQATGYLIAQTNTFLPAAPIYAKWIYQHQDGSFDTYPPSAVSPVIGRFAYWIDDEASKINLNTAWNRNTANATNGSIPTRVSLDVLSTTASGGLNPTNIYTYASTNHLNSVDEMGRAGVPLDTLQQKFSTTAYSHSPDLSMIGTPRILLTTQKWLADANGTTNFLDVLNPQSTAPLGQPGHYDPGPLINLDPSQTTNVLYHIYNELANTGWPMAPGKSFAAKYPGTSANAPDAAQIALNILDYVRGVESTNTVVEPIRIGTSSELFNAWTPNAANQFSRFSVGRRLYITEIGMWFPYQAPVVPLKATATVPGYGVQSGAWYYTAKSYIKLYLPFYPGSQGVDLTKYRFACQNADILPPSSYPTTGTNFVSTIFAGPIMASNIVFPTTGTTTMLYPGHTVTIAGPHFIYKAKIGVTFPPWSMSGSSPFNMRLQYYLTTGSQANRDEVLLLSSYAMDTNQAGPQPIGVTSYSTDDPMVNQGSKDWASSKSGTNSFLTDSLNTANLLVPSAAGQPPTTPPGQAEQDCDASGNVTTNYMWVPAPNGDTGNPSGIVHSVAELGFVHTGTDGGTNNAVAGAPWRTLHLQPQKNTTLLPDWAILDLFSAPIYTNVVGAASLPYVLPTTNSITTAVVNRGGQVNINSATYCFSANNNSAISANRVLPLAALLNGATTNTVPISNPSATLNTVSQTRASTLASNILNYATATGVGSAQGTNYDAGKATTNYYSAGQLAEVSGISDTGESSEATLRDIASLASVNGNVFSIYAVGQALKQDASGKLHVVAEQRKQVIIERLIISGSPPTVQFQTVYSRDL